jgi:hypothetical protein
MRVQARPGSAAEAYYLEASGLPGQPWPPRTKQLAPGISPAPLEDLIYHGGKTVPQMEFQNIFLGAKDAWNSSDPQFIDDAIRLAMQDRRLNTVLAQYFHGTRLECSRRDMLHFEDSARVYDEPQVQDMVVALFDHKLLHDRDLESCLFNLILPPGAELRLGNSSSHAGLGGYHGSVHIERGERELTLYYSANVYSEIRAGKENGISAFTQPWKNVVATLYHELNEFRTDADVSDAIQHSDNDFLGWTSRKGMEIGDQPIMQAGANLALVFKQILNSTRTVSLPVQLLYSNKVHGAEDPTHSHNVS